MKVLVFSLAVFLISFIVAFSVFGAIVWFRTHNFYAMIIPLVVSVIAALASVVQFLMYLKK
jgi:hypothetical protein